MDTGAVILFRKGDGESMALVQLRPTDRFTFFFEDSSGSTGRLRFYFSDDEFSTTTPFLRGIAQTLYFRLVTITNASVNRVNAYTTYRFVPADPPTGTMGREVTFVWERAMIVMPVRQPLDSLLPDAIDDLDVQAIINLLSVAGNFLGVV